MADMFVAYDRQLNVVFVNRALDASSGERQGNLVGRSHWDLWPDTRGTIVEESYSRALETGLPVHFEFQSPGTGRWADVDVFPSGDYLHVYLRDVTAKKHDQDELRAMVDSLPQIAWASDSDHIPWYLNRQWYEYTGLTPEEPYDPGKVVHPDDFPIIWEKSKQAEAAGVPVEVEARLRRQDGVYRWFLIREVPRRSSTQAVTGYFGSSTDVHDLREAREALRARDELSRSVLSTAVEGIAVISADGSMLLSNAAFDQLHYTEGEEPLEALDEFRSLFELYEENGAFVPHEQWPARRALAGERVERWDLLVRRTGSAEFWGSYSAAPVYDDSGKVTAAVLSVFDVTDRVEAEKALRDAKARIEAILASADVATWVLDVPNDRVYADRNIARLFAVDESILEGGPASAYIAQMHPDDRQAVTDALQTAIAEGVPYDVDYRIVANDEERWVTARGIPERDDEGKIVRLPGVVVDITDLKQAQERERGLAASAEAQHRLLDTVLDALPTAVVIVDGSGKVIRVNPAAKELWGVPPETESWEQYGEWVGFWPETGQRIQAHEWATARALFHGETTRNQLIENEKFGSRERRSFINNVAPVYGPDGNLSAIVAAMQDVTELRTLARTLQESEERFRLLVESVPEIAWTARPDGTLDYYNERWYEYTGNERGTEGHESWVPALHPDDAGTLAVWLRSVASGEPYETELRLREVTTGEYRWFLARARPIRDSEGNIVRWFGITSDIHDQKVREHNLAFLADLNEAIRTLSDANEVIETSQRMLGEYLETSRCAYAEVESDEDTFTIVRDWSPTLPSTVGTYSLRLFGATTAERLRRGQTTSWSNVDSQLASGDGRETFNSIGIKAVICCSLIKEGTLAALMALHQDRPRIWTKDEVELLETVADRCWSEMERVRAERALLQSEAQYRQVAEGLPQLVWSAGPDGRRDYFNDRWREFTGLSLDTEGDPWSAALHPNDRPDAQAAWRHAVETGETFQAEYRLRNQDGKYRWFLGRAIAIRDEEGHVVRWFGTCTYIHDLRVTQDVLQITNDFAATLAQDLDLERIVQALTDASTSAVGAEFGSFFYNVTNETGDSFLLYTLSGAPREAFENFGLPRATPVFGPTFRGEGIVRSDNITKDPRYGQMGEPHHGMPKGHLPVVSYLAVPVISRSGEVIGGLFFGHSQPGVFSEEDEGIVASFAAQAAVAIDNARLYDQVRGMNQELEQKVQERTANLLSANERLQGFTYHVSHDLRAPLRAIVSTSRIIQDDFGGQLPAEVNRLLNRQAEAANKLGQLVDDLLKLSRLSRQEMVRQSVDLSQIAKDASGEALSTHPYTEVQVEVAEGLTALADPRLLRLALLNLIENGIKYSPHGGTVRVGQREDGAYFVSDEGIGMEGQYLERIFEPFQRLHRDEEFKGTGIGLANVRQVVERHGGRIWAESEKGRGSAFLFTLE